MSGAKNWPAPEDVPSKALVPEPPSVKPERYRAGPSEVFGHPPGSEFEAVIPEPQRSQLLQGGALETVGRKAVPPATPSGPTKDKE